MKNLPNLLSLLRLLLAVPLAWAICGSSLASAQAAVLCVVLVELTDWLDGTLARRYGWQTELGRWLDPLADSIARSTAFVALHSSGGFLSLPMLLVLLWRDQLVAYLRTDAARRGLDVGARSSGKLKAVAQATAIFWVCVGRVAAHPDVGQLDPATLLQWSHRLMALAVAVTLYSAFDYFRGFTQISRQ